MDPTPAPASPQPVTPTPPAGVSSASSSPFASPAPVPTTAAAPPAAPVTPMPVAAAAPASPASASHLSSPSVAAAFMPPADKPKRRYSWLRIRQGASGFSWAAAIIGILVIGGIGLAFATSLRKKPAASSALSNIDLKNPPGGQIKLGSTDQVLNVNAPSVFNSKLTAGQDLAVNGQFSSVGSATFNAITASTASSNTADIKSNFTVGGTSRLQGAVTIQNLLAVAGDLNTTGKGSFGGELTAASLNVRGAVISGLLNVGGHLAITGAPASASPSGGLGTAGTASLSGSDTSGVVNFNAGNGATAGILGNVNFRNAYASTPRVILTPANSKAAGLQYYVTATPSGFSIGANNPSSGNSYSFNYLVIQ